MAIEVEELEYVNRTEREHLLPSVVICCGGMGYYMGNAFKKRLVEYYPKGLDSVEFVYLDIDEPTTRVPHYIKDRVELSAPLWDIWQDPGAFPEISRWFSKDVITDPKTREQIENLIKELGKTKFGAGACRPFGRCSIFVKAREVELALEKAVNRVWNDQSKDLNFFILSSLGGGTGTGIFMDVAAILRWMRRERFSQSTGVWEIFGILVGPGLLTKDEDEEHEITPNAASVFRANTYAALKELNYFLHGNPFSACYPYLGDVEISNLDQYDRLFNFVFLVDKTNQEGRKFSTKLDLGEMVGDFLFFLHFTDVRGMFFTRFPNIRTVDQAFLNEYEGQKTLFSTFGTATVEFPINRLLEWCVLRKVVETVGRFLGEGENFEDEVNLVLEGSVGRPGKLEEFGLDKDRIVQDLIDKLLPERPVISRELDDSARKMIEGLGTRMTPSMSGLITQRGLKGRIYEWVSSLISDNFPLAMEVLKGLKERIRRMKEEVRGGMGREEMERYKDEYEFYTDISDELERLRDKPWYYKLFHKKGIRRNEEDLEESRQMLREMILRYGAGLLCLSFLGNLEKELDMIDQNEISPIKRTFERIRELFEEEMARVTDRLRNDEALCLYRIKTNSDFLERFYERFSSEVDTLQIVQDLSEAKQEDLPFVRWAGRGSPEEVGNFIRKRVEEEVEVEGVLSDVELTGARKLWEIDFTDIKDDSNREGVFILREGVGRDDFDEIEEELRKRAAPALRYREAGIQTVSLSYLINRLKDESLDLQGWWKGKLKKLNFASLRGRYHNKVSLINLRFGIPLAVLEFIDDWKEQYEIQKTKGHPLHLFPGAEYFPEPYF